MALPGRSPVLMALFQGHLLLLSMKSVGWKLVLCLTAMRWKGDLIGDQYGVELGYWECSLFESPWN